MSMDGQWSVCRTIGGKYSRNKAGKAIQNEMVIEVDEQKKVHLYDPCTGGYQLHYQFGSRGSALCMMLISGVSTHGAKGLTILVNVTDSLDLVVSNVNSSVKPGRAFYSLSVAM